MSGTTITSLKKRELVNLLFLVFVTCMLSVEVCLLFALVPVVLCLWIILDSTFCQNNNLVMSRNSGPYLLEGNEGSNQSARSWSLTGALILR